MSLIRSGVRVCIGLITTQDFLVAGPPMAHHPIGAYTIQPHMPPPLAFTDSQITAIMDAAQPLARADRAAFLEAVVEALEGRPIGDGQVFRAVRAAQGRYRDAPKWGTR